MYIFQATEDFKKEVFLISRWLWFEQGGGRGLEALLSCSRPGQGAGPAWEEGTVLWCAGWWPSCKGASATGSALPLRPLLSCCRDRAPHIPLIAAPIPNLSGVMPVPLALWGVSCPRDGPKQGLDQ